MQRYTFALAVLALVVAAARPAEASSAARPLWADLVPGPYAVGFRTEFAFDRTRSWRVTRGYDRAFVPDADGRPIRVGVWYPASVARGAAAMRYSDYVDVAAPAPFAAYEKVVRARDVLLSGLNVPKGALPALMRTPMNAYRGAAPRGGRFPLVLYCGGLNASTVDNVTLAEMLASRGYVVATVPLLGASSAVVEQTRSQADIETTVRDLEFAWGMLRGASNVDGSRVGVVGHSLGAIDAVLFAVRNQNVTAVVGLDGTYGFAGAASVLTGFYGYDNRRMLAALLDLRHASPATGPSVFVPDPAPVRAMHYADRTTVTVTKMFHADFTEFGILAKTFGFPPFDDPAGRTYDTSYAGYQSAARIVADFLDLHLRGRREAEGALRADVAAASGGTFAHEDGLPAPPTERDLVDIAARRGVDAALAVVDRYGREAPGDVVASESRLNALGYELQAGGNVAGAIAALLIAAHLYPASANVSDSLGDMYAAAGRTADARAAYRHALDLLPSDASQDAAGKASLTAEIQRALARLPN